MSNALTPYQRPGNYGPSPYYQGYLDAAVAHTYITFSRVMRMPKLRYYPGSPAHQAWQAGIDDWLMDQKPMPARRRAI